MAARAGREGLLKLLLESGADATARELAGKSAYQIAIENRHTDVAELSGEHRFRRRVRVL